MIETTVIENTINFVKETLKDAEGGHDWFHIERVYKNALHITEKEGGNVFIISLGALLHDIADYKFHNGNEQVGPKMAGDFLSTQEVSEEIISHVINIVNNISFKGGNTDRKFDSLELDIVQDADRLDALGAIGIARTFNYGGFKGRSLHDPSIAPNMNMTKEEYKNSTAPTLNHFYEKLLLLSARMNTRTGQSIAAERHSFMENFLEQFYAEWEGKR